MGVSLRAMVTMVTSIGAFSAGLFSLLPQLPSANANSRQAGTRMRGDVRTSRECIGETSTKAARQNSRRKHAGEAVLFLPQPPRFVDDTGRRLSLREL